MYLFCNLYYGIFFFKYNYMSSKFMFVMKIKFKQR